MSGELKSELINDAFSRLRISGLTAIPTPEDYDVALIRLEGMAQEFLSRNIPLNYNFEDSPDLNSTHNIPKPLQDSVKLILAYRLIPDFGKGAEPDPILINQVTGALSFLNSATSNPREVQYPSRMPVGSGNSVRTLRFRRFYYPQAEAPNDGYTKYIYLGDTNDYTEHFDTELINSEVVSSFTIAVDAGLQLISSSLTSPDVFYRIRAIGTTAGTGNPLQQVVIIATLDTGRIITRIINFYIKEVV